MTEDQPIQEPTTDTKKETWFNQTHAVKGRTLAALGLGALLLGVATRTIDFSPRSRPPAVAQNTTPPPQTVPDTTPRDSAAGSVAPPLPENPAQPTGMNAPYTGKHCLPQFSATDSVYTVKKGDVPWAIACGLLPRGATIGQIDSTLRVLQTYNTGKFGADDMVVINGRVTRGTDGLYDHLTIGARVALRTAAVAQQPTSKNTASVPATPIESPRDSTAYTGPAFAPAAFTRPYDSTPFRLGEALRGPTKPYSTVERLMLGQPDPFKILYKQAPQPVPDFSSLRGAYNAEPFKIRFDLPLKK